MSWTSNQDRVRDEIRAEEAGDKRPPYYDPDEIEPLVNRVVERRTRLLSAEAMDNGIAVPGLAALVTEVLEEARKIVLASRVEFSYDGTMRQKWHVIIRLGTTDDRQAKQIEDTVRALMRDKEVPDHFIYVECRY